MRVSLIALCGALLAGCSSQATLTLHSQPEGAYIIDRASGTIHGMAPVTLSYDAAKLAANKLADGCYLVRGLEARWVSGATAALDGVRLCGSKTGDYTLVFNRKPGEPGFDKDAQFALKLRAVKAQQQQAEAVEDVATAALINGALGAPRTDMKCVSVQVGLTVQTTCR